MQRTGSHLGEHELRVTIAVRDIGDTGSIRGESGAARGSMIRGQTPSTPTLGGDEPHVIVGNEGDEITVDVRIPEVSVGIHVTHITSMHGHGAVEEEEAQPICTLCEISSARVLGLVRRGDAAHAAQSGPDQ
ncbi:hypothetical protein GCM10009689_27600 [Brevibacterium antiquum]